MPRNLRQRLPQKTPVVEHDIDESKHLLNPEDFLEQNHPANDQYMRSLEHLQRQIMGTVNQLRPKQVKILKSVFAGASYREAARVNSTSPHTVSRVVRSKLGSGLLSALQHHQTMIEGPNLAQRRNMLWRIAKANELIDPKETRGAIAELNKMTLTDHTAKIDKEQDPDTAKNKPIYIDPDLLPAGNLDR